jgi:hypothetical protein
VHDLESFLDLDSDQIKDLENAAGKQSFFGRDGLYFCGFYVSPMSMLREIGIEAKEIANDIAGKRLQNN